MKRAAILLVLVVAASAAARIPRCGEGLPYLYHWDEPATASIALQMMKSGDFNPHFFHYGTVLTYACLLQDIFYYLHLMGQPQGAGPYLASLDEISTYHDTGWYWTISHPGFYFWNRFLVATLGTLSVALTWLLAARLAGPWAGLAAAALLGGSQLHIAQSSLVVPNVLVSFLALCAATLSLRFLATAKRGYFLLALVACGLAASAKYNAAICLVIPLVVLIIQTVRTGFRDNTLLWAALPAVPAVAFLAGTPHAFLDLPAFLKGAGYQMRHYFVRGHGTSTVAPGMSHLWLQARSLSSDLGVAAVALALVGVARMARHALGATLLLFSAAYLIFMAGTKVDFERNLVLVYPFIVTAAGCGAVTLYHWCARAGPRLVRAAVALLVLAVGYGLPASVIREVGAGGRQDTRTRAMDLVKALPADATPAIQPGISSELRVHRLDLNRLDAGHQVSPVLDLLCDNPSPDRVIVTANDFDVFDVANRLPAQSLEDLVGSMLQPLQQLPAVGPMYLDRPSRSPGILLARRKPPAEAGTLECGPTTPGGELEQDGLYAVWANGTVAIPPGGAVSTLPQIAKPGMYFFHYTASGTPRRDDRPGLTFRAIGLYPGGRREELLGAGVAATTEMSPWLIRFDNKDAPLLQLRLEFPRAARYSAESFLYLRSVRVAAIVPPAGR